MGGGGGGGGGGRTTYMGVGAKGRGGRIPTGEAVACSQRCEEVKFECSGLNTFVCRFITEP